MQLEKEFECDLSDRKMCVNACVKEVLEEQRWLEEEEQHQEDEAGGGAAAVEQQQQQQSESAEGGNDDDGNKNEEKGGDGGEGAAADMVEEEEAGSLEVGDQILYNDTRSGPAGTNAARRETVILEIKKSEKYPLRLQNGGCLESDYDYVMKVKTADGKETGATRSFRIDKFHLVDGILDKVTDREAAAARVSQEMVGIATEFPEVRK